MKILFKRESIGEPGLLEVENCYLKHLRQSSDAAGISRRLHSHVEYEIHIVTEGSQSYELQGGEIISVEAGSFLLIPPEKKHRALGAADDMEKYSITFFSGESLVQDIALGQFGRRALDSLLTVSDELANKRSLSQLIVKNRIFEVILLVLRSAGYNDAPQQVEEDERDERILLAEKYIRDNLEYKPSVSDVALYCHLSERQLNRLFILANGVSVSKYVNELRMRAIARELIESDAEIKEICFKYSYDNEYYFSATFKKYFGMPPTEYRAVNGK